MVSRKKSIHVPIYQLKVTLKDIGPPIWRRLQVRSDTTLLRLHQIIQGAMGWDNYHLHQFISQGAYYGQPHSDYGFEVRDEKRVRLSQIISGEKFKFSYEYDFGDGWDHEVLVEKILAFDPEGHYPRCIKGKRACPPEDCGGPWGYMELLAILQDPDHPDYEERQEWIGDSIDPEAFDLDQVNETLQVMR